MKFSLLPLSLPPVSACWVEVSCSLLVLPEACCPPTSHLFSRAWKPTQVPFPPAAELFRMTGWRFKQSSATPKLLAELPGFICVHWPALPTGP